MEPAAAKIEPQEFEHLIRTGLSSGSSFDFKVERLEHGFARIRLFGNPKHLRPGDTISGPVMFTLADTALYAAVLSAVGMVPLAVTTDMNIHFLRRPRPGDLLADARLLKEGSKLMVGEIHIYSDGDPKPVAHVVGTYAVPPSRGSS